MVSFTGGSSWWRTWWGLRNRFDSMHSKSMVSPKLYLAPFPRYSVMNSIENHPTPVWVSRSRGSLSNFIIELGRRRVNALSYIFSENCMIFSRFIAIHHRLRQTDDILCQWWNLHCNVLLKNLKADYLTVEKDGVYGLADYVWMYKVGQLKWGQLTFLMVTFECIGKIQWFLAHVNYIQQEVVWCKF